VEEMNEEMIRRWNETVGPDDTVYCLGDFSLAFAPVEHITPRLNGKKFLIPGNHDFCHSYHKKSRSEEGRAKWTQKYIDNGWTVLPEQTTLEIDGIGTVNMCHHPYHFVDGDHHDDKYERWRPKDNGKWLLCGHVHEKWKKVGYMVNVGVDQWDYKPVSIEQLKDFICSMKYSIV